MMRAVLGFVVGVILWMPAFFLIVFLVALGWPEYAAHGQVWFDTGVYTFEAPMSVVNATSWALAAVFAGWVAVAIARRPHAAWALAAVLALYLGFSAPVSVLAQLSLVVQRRRGGPRRAGRAAGEQARTRLCSARLRSSLTRATCSSG